VADRIDAAKWLAERGWGRAPMSTEGSADADSMLADLIRVALTN